MHVRLQRHDVFDPEKSNSELIIFWSECLDPALVIGRRHFKCGRFGQDSLTAGTLSFSDIQNNSDFTATSTGFSEGLSSDIASSNHPSHGTASVPGGGGGIPTYAHDSGSSSSTTRSAVGAGQIQVTDANHQAQDVANLSRDTTGTNGVVSKLPDVNSTIAQQADLMNAVSAAGEAVATKIGDYADSKRDDAIKEAKAAQDRGNLDAMRGYLDEVKSWDEGGSNRTMLHVAGGGLIGGLGGGGVGSAMQGAAGAGLASSLAGTTKQIADAIGAETGSDLLGKLAGNTLAGIGGGIVGGTTGAAAAANVNLYNQWRDSGSTDIDTLERAAGISDGGKRTSTLERILKGIALAANAVLGMEGGPPPGASPSAVLVNSAAGALPAQALAGQGIAPSHAIFNDGGDKEAAASTSTTTSNGTANAATGPKLADSLASSMSKPLVSDSKLSGLMDDLYRDGAKIGTGSTADAVRYENQTGSAVGGVYHSQKAQDYSTALQRWLDGNPGASFSDRSAAQNVLRDLQNALKGK
ncbi:hypothetical protein [Burkholderia gladioli]|uniref:hypothetical protein n=1 Tax=Burkholderia gladioli TaxID=28095 RepID=UPI0019D1CFD5|nr:hypothetical protein [Burkholderia gladioli]